ncbi:MAG: hypothetical protein ACRESK_04030 [Gammaproteobacteria bacterium]
MAALLTEIFPDSSAGELPGRLFTTPEERNILDSLRSPPANNFEQPLLVDDLVVSEDKLASQSFTINGLVYSARGGSTAWINNKRILLNSTHIRRQPSAGGRIGDVLIDFPDYGATVRLSNQGQLYTEN